MLSNPRIVCAAVKFNIGNDLYPNGIVIAGARHCDHLMRNQCILIFGEKWRFMDYEFGFIDQHDRFWDRESAYVIAEYNKQILRHVETGKKRVLYSEHLY